MWGLKSAYMRRDRRCSGEHKDSKDGYHEEQGLRARSGVGGQVDLAFGNVEARPLLQHDLSCAALLMLVLGFYPHYRHDYPWRRGVRITTLRSSSTYHPEQIQIQRPSDIRSPAPHHQERTLLGLLSNVPRRRKGPSDFLRTQSENNYPGKTARWTP